VKSVSFPELLWREALITNWDACFSKQLDDTGLGEGVGFGQAAGRPALLIAIGHLSNPLGGDSMDQLGRGPCPALTRFSGRGRFFLRGQDLVEAGFVVATSVGVPL